MTVATGGTVASFKRVSVKNGRVTVSGSLNRAAAKKGTRVKLFAFQTATGTTFRQVGQRDGQIGQEDVHSQGKPEARNQLGDPARVRPEG